LSAFLPTAAAAALSGSAGSTGVIVIELYKADENAQPVGVASDSLGNVYKVALP